MKDYILRNRVYTGISIIALVLLWKFLSLFIDMEIIFPSPESTLKNLIAILSSPGFLRAVLNTVSKSLIGFFLALLLSLSLGILSGVVKPIYYLLKPLLTVIKSTPTIGIILLLLIWFRSDYAPLFIGFLIIFPILYTNVVEGIFNVEEDLLEMARMYRVKNIRIIREIYMPSILSYLMSGMSTALGLNLKTVIAAEVLSQSLNTIGDNLYLEKIKLNTAGVFGWIIVAIGISNIFELILCKIYRSIVKWD